MITTKRINNIVVKPIPLEKIDNSRIKGFDMFNEIYGNIFLCSKKKSGKTCVINKILNNCIGKDTKVTIFSSTVEKDKNWKYIVKKLKKKNITVVTFTSLKEGKDDVLSELIDTLIEDVSDDEEEEENKKKEKKPAKLFICDEDEEEMRKRKKRKSKYLCPEHIIIFDDLSKQMRNVNIEQLLKTNRHYKMKVILSSQYLHDITPEARKQLDYCIMFKGQKEKKLEIIHEDLDLSIPFEDFLKLYRNATEKKFNFIYIDVQNEIFRKNFNDQLICPP